MERLRKKIADLEQRVKEEVERNTNLEQYTRRENLRFNYIKESEEEDCTIKVLKSFEEALKENGIIIVWGVNVC